MNSLSEFVFHIDISGIDNVRVRLSANASSVSCIGGSWADGN